MFGREGDRLHRLSTPVSGPREEHQEPSSFSHELGHIIDNKKLLHEELRTLFFAGIDTAAAFPAKPFLILVQHPKIWREARHEANRFKVKSRLSDSLDSA